MLALKIRVRVSGRGNVFYFFSLGEIPRVGDWLTYENKEYVVTIVSHNIETKPIDPLLGSNANYLTSAVLIVEEKV